MEAANGIRAKQGVPLRDALVADRVCGAANVVIAGGWVWLHWPVLTWLAHTLVRPDTRLNLALLVVAAVALGSGTVRRLRLHGVRISIVPVAGWPAVLLTLVAALAYVAVEYFWAVHVISAALFGLGTYGLVSLYYPSRSLPAALLLVAVLPFGAYLDVYVGFPARLLTARVIEQLLSTLHISSASAETILVLENGVAHIDLQCSGVQSLWTGLLFFLSATCCERPALDLRWTAIGVLLAITPGAVDELAARIHAPGAGWTMPSCFAAADAAVPQRWRATPRGCKPEPVVLILKNGTSYRANIGSVGDHFVVLTQPAQKEFFDVLVAIDEIAAVEARAREQ